MPLTADDKTSLLSHGLLVEREGAAHFVAILEQADGTRVSFVVEPGSGVVSTRVLGSVVRPTLSPAAKAAGRFLDKRFGTLSMVEEFAARRAKRETRLAAAVSEIRAAADTGDAAAEAAWAARNTGDYEAAAEHAEIAKAASCAALDSVVGMEARIPVEDNLMTEEESLVYFHAADDQGMRANDASMRAQEAAIPRAVVELFALLPDEAMTAEFEALDIARLCTGRFPMNRRAGLEIDRRAKRSAHQRMSEIASRRRALAALTPEARAEHVARLAKLAEFAGRTGTPIEALTIEAA